MLIFLVHSCNSHTASSTVQSPPFLSFPPLPSPHFSSHHLAFLCSPPLLETFAWSPDVFSLCCCAVHLSVLDGVVSNWHRSCLSPFRLLSKGHHIWPADIISMVFSRGLFTASRPLGSSDISQPDCHPANKQPHKHTSTFTHKLSLLFLTQFSAQLSPRRQCYWHLKAEALLRKWIHSSLALCDGFNKTYVVDVSSTICL